MTFIKSIGRTLRTVTGSLQKLNRGLCALSVFTVAILNPSGTAQATGLQVVSVTASADDGNAPANTLDGSLSTRWSAAGDGQWIQFDLGAAVSVGAIRVGWYLGNQRSSRFDVRTSSDAANWTTVFSGASSGATLALESYDLTATAARYVRVVGHGNSANSA